MKRSKSKKPNQAKNLVPSGYAEREQDCPEWLQGEFAKLYLGCPDHYKRSFDAGRIAVKWGYEPEKWYSWCLRKDA